MKKAKRIKTKVLTFLVALSIAVGIGTVAYAASFGNKKNGASSYESFQVLYNGKAWNYRNSGYKYASFKYTRNKRTLLTKTAYNGTVSGSVWDDLIHWGDKYTTHFSWSRGR